MTINTSTSGSGILARVRVISFPRENLSVRGTAVKAELVSGRIDTGTRLRSVHLISMPAGGTGTVAAAVKDANDLWTEWSDASNVAFGDFVAGSTAVSIGSGATEDLHVEEPAVRFPLPNLGSSRFHVRRTLVQEDAFYGEQRSSAWPRTRAVFYVSLSDLDEDETLLLHRFWTGLNGPASPFFFDWTDPVTGTETRYVVRFREPTLASELFVVERSSMSFTLVELIGASTGGEV